MRLVVTSNDGSVNEFQFKAGPINIGRHTDSQIFLSDRTVSRHHAVIFRTQQGKWMVEDLGSANKTYLNDFPVQKAEIETHDHLRITNFTIDINLEDDTIADQPINLEDTLTKTAFALDDTRLRAGFDPKVIVRRLDSEHAPDLNLPARRAIDFVHATEAICHVNDLDEMVQVLLNIATKQFASFHSFCALRTQPIGPMTCHAGKQINGSSIEMSEIELSENINEAVEKNQFQLLPKIPYHREKQRINSALIAPISGQAGCFGVLYIDNALDHESYTLSDLDYLMLLAIHTSVIIENF